MARAHYDLERFEEGSRNRDVYPAIDAVLGDLPHGPVRSALFGTLLGPVKERLALLRVDLVDRLVEAAKSA